uniref:Acyltransferase 3 n=1 Tax=Cyanothece sp. (strain PCC 7425 / ATCC 29141) TaxID=395961 RepID=B8HS92_CYAP4
MTKVASQRNYTVDFLRTVSILYIIAYWHLFGYTEALPGYRNIFTSGLKVIVLATFVFISGFLLSKGSMSLAPKQVLGFYQKRLVRIYPLYLLALVLLKLTDATYGSGIKAALLISMFDPPAIRTLWFITMIMFFYVIAPCLIYQARNIFKFGLLASFVMLLFGMFHLVINPIDTRLVMYFPAFALGILFQTQASFRQYCLQNKLHLGILLLLSFLLSLVPTQSDFIGSLLLIPLTISGVLCLFTYSEPWVNQLPLKEAVTFLSYASFCMYLFHRVIFHWAIALFYPQNPILQCLYLFLVCIPLTIAIGWLIQKSYDWMLSRTLQKSTGMLS